MSLPLVSVIIPSYNHSRYIRQSVESVMHQTYPNIELIVIDDASSDDSPRILEELQQQYGFTLICRKENKGVSATLNEGIREYSHGKYIRGLASDDYLPETSVSDQVAYLDQHPDRVLVFGIVSTVDANGVILNPRFGCINPDDMSFEKMLEDDFIVAPSTMYTRNIFNEIGGFDENTPIEDWDFWLRILYNKYLIGYLDQRPLAFYRQHGENTYARAKHMTEARQEIYRRWEMMIPSGDYHRIYSRYLFRYFRIYAGTHKGVAVGLLGKYRFRYFDFTMLREFVKGSLKLLFYRK